MKKLFWIVMAAIAVYHVAHSGSTSGTSVSTEEAAPQVETVRIRARDFMKTMDDNEVAAMSQVEGKRVIVTGVIKSFNLDISDSPIVILSDGERYSFHGVHVAMQSKDDVTNLHKGQRVTLVGVRPAEVMGNLMLRDGEIAQ